MFRGQTAVAFLCVLCVSSEASGDYELMSNVVGAMMRQMLLRPRVKRATWPQLCAAAMALHERFTAMIQGVSEAGAAVESDDGFSIRSIFAQLATENRRVAGVLESIRRGVGPMPVAPVIARTLVEARAAYADSWTQLGMAAAQPIESGMTVPHELFGPLTAAEWLATVGYQHELHARRIERIMASEEYRRAQGAAW
jgi:hypothetical protein